jgi:ribulose-5-phosphate 4-epimerase/fuculose-1-phosphate aldolase
MSMDSDAAPGEGVIRFRWTLGAPVAVPEGVLAALRTLHGAGRAHGAIGRDPDRYEGLAFGNLSVRDPASGGFWITASQRVDRPRLEPEDLVRVDAVAPDGAVHARGVHPPSSESLCHAAVYAATPAGAALHGHLPRLWRAADALGLPTTPPAAHNGTRALADAVAATAAEAPEGGLLAMAGHEDGILCWAADAAAVVTRLEAALAALDPSR